jgi:hypothetical protein
MPQGSPVPNVKRWTSGPVACRPCYLAEWYGPQRRSRVFHAEDQSGSAPP